MLNCGFILLGLGGEGKDGGDKGEGGDGGDYQCLGAAAFGWWTWLIFFQMRSCKGGFAGEWCGATTRIIILDLVGRGALLYCPVKDHSGILWLGDGLISSYCLKSVFGLGIWSSCTQKTVAGGLWLKRLIT